MESVIAEQAKQLDAQANTISELCAELAQKQETIDGMDKLIRKQTAQIRRSTAALSTMEEELALSRCAK